MVFLQLVSGVLAMDEKIPHAELAEAQREEGRGRI